MSSDVLPLFLFSLPRSGSTLSQRILAAHRGITTVTEPCILLPYLYSLRDKGVYSEYGHEVTAWGIQDFCRALPNGQADYLKEIRSVVLRLYAKAAQPGAKLFVDKTPNYSFIAGEIIELFPDAKFIFLWRNPLSIVSSLVTMWHGGRWSLYQYDVHLYEGLGHLINAFQKHRHRVQVIRYEDMLASPLEEWQRVFEYLEMPFDPESISRYKDVQLPGRLGDHTGKKYDRLSQEPLEKWKSILANPIRKAWCRRYLKWIGRERLAVMGYDFDELMAELYQVKFSKRFFASDLWWFPYSAAYRVLEGRIMKHKLKDLTSGRRVHIHK